jgi:ribokinase
MITVFGSINVDLVARVAALPGPGETVLAPDYTVVAGGKGANQAVAAARAREGSGAKTHMIGCVGRDGFADIALATMRDCTIDLSAVVAVAEPTACAMIGVDPAGANQIIVASGANRHLRAAQLDDGLLGVDTTLVLQLEVDPGETWAVIARAKVRGARVILNTAPAAPVPPDVAASCDILVMNEIEAVMLSSHGNDPVEAARALSLDWGVTTVVTLGAEGAWAFEPGATWRIRALAVEAIDSTAAGDAFVGVLAAALDGGSTLAEALGRASVAGGLACETAGAQPSLPGRAAIEQALSRLAPAESL